MKRPTRKTITADELIRLAAVNSPRMPTVVEQDGRRLEWTGIGWLDCEPARGDEVLVVEDEP